LKIVQSFFNIKSADLHKIFHYFIRIVSPN